MEDFKEVEDAISGIDLQSKSMWHQMKCDKDQEII
jgi:hypothetical protein